MQPGPSVKSAMVNNQTLFGEDSDDELEHLPEARAVIVKEQKLMNETWYVISLVKNKDNEKKHVMRRYEDFVELDESLRALLSKRAWGSAEPLVTYVPDLPRPGRFGLRASLSAIGLGNFNEQLKDGFQMYLDAILWQVPVIEEVSPLYEFFNVAITEQTRQRWDAPKMRQAIVKTMTSQAEMKTPLRDEANELAGSITENNAAMMMVYQLRATLRKMDEHSAKVEVSPRTADEARQEIFKIGGLVVIVGLERKPHHNGKICHVVDYLDAVKQYYVTLDDGRRKRIRDINLRRAPPSAKPAKAMAARRGGVEEEDDERVYKENILKDWARFVLKLG